MAVLLLSYAALLVVSALADRLGMRRPLMIAMLPLIALDCLCNLVLLQSWRNTMSGEAWHHREHRYWGWCYRVINGIFFWQADHCRVQAERETARGGVWASWWADFVRDASS